MFSLTSSHRYYLYRNATDMRKNFDGLCGIVDGQLHRNPMSGEVFIFVSKRRDKVKLLHWEQGGFTLYYKRLEAGTLELPPLGNEPSVPMQWSQLVMMIEGISLKSTTVRKRFSFKKSE